jgi:D-beta-D-heptose 7-phosphate kinase/D-beta-D-heptose 1-phosphate adenosyltransferase
LYGKIIAPDQAQKRLLHIKSLNTKLVFTNGCFDLLHPGHIEYLIAARALGSQLIVGVNDDASVSRLKGPSRPYNTLQDRMAMLAALQSVDYVIPFSEDTPLELITAILPHIIVKGGDYTTDQMIGADLVQGYGGEVVILPFKEGYSSTGLIEKIRGGG